MSSLGCGVGSLWQALCVVCAWCRDKFVLMSLPEIMAILNLHLKGLPYHESGCLAAYRILSWCYVWCPYQHSPLLSVTVPGITSSCPLPIESLFVFKLPALSISSSTTIFHELINTILLHTEIQYPIMAGNGRKLIYISSFILPDEFSDTHNKTLSSKTYHLSSQIVISVMQNAAAMATPHLLPQDISWASGIR